MGLSSSSSESPRSIVGFVKSSSSVVSSLSTRFSPVRRSVLGTFVAFGDSCIAVSHASLRMLSDISLAESFMHLTTRPVFGSWIQYEVVFYHQ